LTLTVAHGVLRDALAGYRDLVETNFAGFGAALGLQSILPVRAEGFVIRPDEGSQDMSVRMIISLSHDPSLDVRGDAPVSLQLISDDAYETIKDFAEPRARNARQTAFGPPPIEEPDLDLHLMRPATNLAYKWLARDLQSVGWLNDSIRYSD
jgi:hypothetical protein